MKDLNWELINSFEFNGRPTDEDLKRGSNLVKEFVKSIYRFMIT